MAASTVNRTKTAAVDVSLRQHVHISPILVQLGYHRDAKRMLWVVVESKTKDKSCERKYTNLTSSSLTFPFLSFNIRGWHEIHNEERERERAR